MYISLRFYINYFSGSFCPWIVRIHRVDYIALFSTFDSVGGILS